jgi:hypothetical protein
MNCRLMTVASKFQRWNLKISGTVASGLLPVDSYAAVSKLEARTLKTPTVVASGLLLPEPAGS